MYVENIWTTVSIGQWHYKVPEHSQWLTHNFRNLPVKSSLRYGCGEKWHGWLWHLRYGSDAKFTWLFIHSENVLDWCVCRLTIIKILFAHIIEACIFSQKEVDQPLNTFICLDSIG